MKRFTVTAPPYNFGNPSRRCHEATVGDVFEVVNGPDDDGDYYGKVARSGRHAYISKDVLKEIVPKPPIEKVAVEAVKRAAKAIGMGDDAVEVLIRAAKAIEAGI